MSRALTLTLLLTAAVPAHADWIEGRCVRCPQCYSCDAPRNDKPFSPTGPVRLMPPEREFYRKYPWKEAHATALISYKKYKKRRTLTHKTDDPRKLALIAKIRKDAAKYAARLKEQFAGYIKGATTKATAKQLACVQARNAAAVAALAKYGAYGRDAFDVGAANDCAGVPGLVFTRDQSREAIYLQNQLRYLAVEASNLEFWISQGEAKLAALPKTPAAATPAQQTTKADPPPEQTHAREPAATPPAAAATPDAPAKPTAEEEDEKIDLLAAAKALSADVDELRGLKKKLIAQADAVVPKADAPASPNAAATLAAAREKVSARAAEIQRTHALPVPDAAKPPAMSAETEKLLGKINAAAAIEEAGKAVGAGDTKTALSAVDRAAEQDPSWREAKQAHADILRLAAAKAPTPARLREAAAAQREAGAAGAARELDEAARTLALPQIEHYKTEKQYVGTKKILAFRNGRPNAYFSFAGGTLGGEISELHFMRLMMFSTRWRFGLGTAVVSRYATKFKLRPTGLEERNTAVTNFFPLEAALAPLNIRVWHNTVVSPQFYLSYSPWGIASARSLDVTNSRANAKTFEWGLRVPLGAFLGFRVGQVRIEVPEGKLSNIAETPFTGFNESKTFVGVDLTLGAMFGRPTAIK